MEYIVTINNKTNTAHVSAKGSDSAMIMGKNSVFEYMEHVTNICIREEQKIPKWTLIFV